MDIQQNCRPISKLGIQMRIVLWVFFCWVATSTSFSAFAASDEDGLESISDSVGTLNAWRLIPGRLLERCLTESPQNEDAMRTAYGSWSQTNAPLISKINLAIDRVAPLYAASLSVSSSEAMNHINASTVDMIDETYFKNEKVSVSQVCADYDKIVTALSTPGKIATTRGLVYAVESLLASQKQRSSAAQGSKDEK